MKMKTIILAFLILTFFPTSQSLAVVRTHQVYGVYSNMQYNEEGGDLLGMEIFLFFGDQQYYALIQISEGAPSKPQLLPFMLVEDDDILIEYQDDSIIKKITGNIHKDELVVKIHYKTHTTEPVTLKRGQSYWQ